MAQRRPSRGRRNLARPTDTEPQAAQTGDATGSTPAGARGRRAAPAKGGSAMPKILIGGGALVAIIVAAVLITSGDGDKKGTGGSKGTETVADNAADNTAGNTPDAPANASGGGDTGTGSGKGTDIDSLLGPEDDGDKAAQLREDFERKKSLAESIPDRIALAKWCEKNGLKSEMKALVTELLETNPDNSDLNRMSGKKLFDGEHLDYQEKWLTPEEYKKAKEADKEYVAKLASDPKFEAMHATVSQMRFNYLKDFKHTAIRMWPYIVFLEDFGNERANARYAKDYRIRITAFYDYMKKTYPNIVNKEPETPFRIIVLKDRASFNKFNALNGNGASAGARAFYHLQTKFIYTYEKGDGGDSLFERGVVFHECTHQLLDFLRPKNRYSESMWFEEALSDFHAGVKIQPIGDGEFTYELGHLNSARLNQMATALKTKKYFKLSEMFQCRTYGEADAAYRRKFGGGGSRGKGLLYYQGWSFIYFCMEGPNKAHRDAILRYLDQDVGQGEGDYNILNQAFKISNHDQWEPIQREWEAYVRDLIKERKAARAKKANSKGMGSGRKRKKKDDDESK